jgi:hypothetical protein
MYHHAGSRAHPANIAAKRIVWATHRCGFSRLPVAECAAREEKFYKGFSGSA